MILPIRSKNPPEQFPWLTCVIIALNVLVCLILIPQGSLLGLDDDLVKQWGISTANASPITFFSSTFLHADFIHLLGNMWFLYLFGFAVEGKLGWWKFGILYFAAGLTGDLLQLGFLASQNSAIPSIGASGAIMGCIGAAVYLFPHAKVVVWYWLFFFLMGTWNVPMWAIALFYVGGDFFWALLFSGLGVIGGVGYLAHVGGAVGAFFLVMLMGAKRDDEAASEAKETLADTKDYSILSNLQLEDLAKTQPDNTEITIHWVLGTLSRGYRMKPEMVERFIKHAPSLIHSPDGVHVGYILQMLDYQPGFKTAWYLETAMAAEKEGNPQRAQVLYQKAFNHPEATEGDQEAAAYKNAMLMEAWFQNYAGAEDLYRWILQRWPMTSLEGAINARLSVVGPRAAQQRASAHPQ